MSPDDRSWAPPVPEALLVPLTDAAIEVLRTLDDADIPRTLRPLAGFDRRGLTRSAARQQILRGLELDDDFRRAAVEAFMARPEVAHALEQWDPAHPLEAVEAAAGRDDLALLASMLYATRLAGWQFGLGLVHAAAQHSQSERETDEELRSREAQLATLEEARARAEEARTRLEHEVKTLEEDLRSERRSRRAREERLRRAATTAEGERDEALADAQRAREARSVAEAARDRLQERASKLEGELRRLRSAEPRQRQRPELRPEDVEALAEAAALARRLAQGLEGVADHARREAAESRTRRPAPAKRPRVPVPGGMTLDSSAGLDAALRAPGVVLIVDGYNVSMRAWSGSDIAGQRERLVAALAGLQARTRVAITVVFDGADVGAPPPRNPGVRVLFSPEGVEADAVVVREVEALATGVPAIVASSDRWVQDRSQAAGAAVVGSPTLIAALGA